MTSKRPFKPIDCTLDDRDNITKDEHNNHNKYEDDDDDDSDDYFSNPLKHLLPKMLNSSIKANALQSTSSNSSDKDAEQKRQSVVLEESFDDHCDDECSLTDLRNRERKRRENELLSEAEREIQEIERFANNVSKLRPQSISGLSSQEVKNPLSIHREQKEIEILSSDDDDGMPVVDAANGFVIEPSCSIEICDLEEYSSEIIRWKMNDSLKKIVEKYATKWGCDDDCVIISPVSGVNVSKDLSPIDLKFSEKDVNSISLYKDAQKIAAFQQITVKWLLSDRNKPLVASIPKNVAFEVIKQNLAASINLECEKITLVFDSDKIGAHETVETLGIEDGDCIDVYNN